MAGQSNLVPQLTMAKSSKAHFTVASTHSVMRLLQHRHQHPHKLQPQPQHKLQVYHQNLHPREPKFHTATCTKPDVEHNLNNHSSDKK